MHFQFSIYKCEPIQRLVCSSGFDLRPAVLCNVGEIEILDNTAHRLALCQSMRCFFNRHKPRQIGCVGFVGQGRVTYPIFSFARHRAKQGASGFAVVQCLYCNSDPKRKPSDKRVAFSESQ